MLFRSFIAIFALTASAALVQAQSKSGTPETPKGAAAAKKSAKDGDKDAEAKKPPTPAHALFGRHKRPSKSKPASLGTYARGCLSGGMRLDPNGDGWYAMRLNRNRNWGNPAMIAFVRRLAAKAREIGWPALYVGDIGQPRGGPMRYGHRSHQIGLDVDVWLRKPGPTPPTRRQRETMGSHVVVAKDGVNLNDYWTPSHHKVLRAAALDPAVARIFVNAAIKRSMCIAERGEVGELKADWLRKIRPWRGHNAHFHVRLSCPPGSRACRGQAPPPAGSGCGAELARWFPKGTLTRSIFPAGEFDQRPLTRGIRKELVLADLPSGCGGVLADDAKEVDKYTSGAKVATTPSTPVFSKKSVTAHEGFIGTKYFWTPALDRVAAKNRGVALKIKGRLPPGLSFRDRGEGNGLLSGVPTGAGKHAFTVIATAGGREHGRQKVVVPITDLGSGGGTKPSGGGKITVGGGSTGVKLLTPAAATAVKASLQHRVRDFLVEFTGAECFLAQPRRVDPERINVEAFSNLIEPFHALDRAFKKSIGIEAYIGARVIETRQCPALALTRKFPTEHPARIGLDDADHVIGIAQPFEISVKGTGARFLTVLLVGPDGKLQDLSGFTKKVGAEHRISLVLPDPGRRLVLVLDAARPLGGTGLLRAENLPAFFTEVLDNNKARAYDIRASLGYFVVR